MKGFFVRMISVLMVLSLMLGAFVGCDGKDDKKDDGALDNGNVITVTEEGSEDELTAVRENLIKAKETKGFGDVDKMEFYENGVRTTSDVYVQVKDNKKIYYSGDKKRVVNYTDGYILDMPADWAPDFTVSSARSEYKNDDVTLVVSDETEALGIYGGPDSAMEALFRFIGTENYIKENRIDKLGEETATVGDFTLYTLKMHLKDCPEGTKCYYTYAVFYNELKMTYMMFKCVDDRDFADVYNSYQSIYDKGAAIDTISYPEGANENWTAETAELYDSIMNTDHVMWGLVNGNIEQKQRKNNYLLLEKQLDHKFEIVTSYTDQMSFDFDVESARDIYEEEGRIVQFTYHFAYDYGNSNTMGNRASVLDVYRGECDDYLRKFAKSVVELGKPMLFRLNNEMNSDWTTWSATNAMNDTEIFTETWKRMYNILEEEGANDYLIWIWNPQGHMTGPMFAWNDLRMYFPGAKYVHMLGLTGYNFGDDNQWTTFGDMYQALSDYYTPYFGDWAWILAEFGCSDASENPENETRKADWITEMFDCFEADRFPNIKAAVWFNGNDYGPEGQLVHEIALTRDEPAREAFREGLDRTQ